MRMLRAASITLTLLLAAHVAGLAEWSKELGCRDVFVLRSEPGQFTAVCNPVSADQNNALSIMRLDAEGTVLSTSPPVPVEGFYGIIGATSTEQDNGLLVWMDSLGEVLHQSFALVKLSASGSKMWQREIMIMLPYDGRLFEPDCFGRMCSVMGINWLASLTIIDIDHMTGEIVRNTSVKFNIFQESPLPSFVGGRANGPHCLYGFCQQNSTHVFSIACKGAVINGTIVQPEELISVPMRVQTIAELAGGIIMLLGQREADTPFVYSNCIGRLKDGGRTLDWIRTLSTPSASPISFLSISRSLSPQAYYLLTAVAVRGPDLIMFGIREDGSKAWMRSDLAVDNRKTSLVEVSPGVYIYVTSNAGGVRKYTLPLHAARLRCTDLKDFRTCPLGSFWNYTQCLMCPVGCTICTSDEFCLNCSRHFALSPSTNRCTPSTSPSHRGNTSALCGDSCPRNISRGCNCDVSEFSPACAAKCAARPCIMGANSTSVMSAFPGTTRKACTCPQDATVENGTHCLRAYNVGCSDLCSVCTRAPTELCVKCRELPNVMLYQTGKVFVDCRCRFGYWFNGTGCEHIAAEKSRERRHNTDSALAWTVIGVVAAAAVSVLVACKLCRRKTAGVTDSSIRQNVTNHSLAAADSGVEVRIRDESVAGAVATENAAGA